MDCHRHILHTEEEERLLLSKTLAFLFQVRFIPMQSDYDFLLKNNHLIKGKEIEQWLNS